MAKLPTIKVTRKSKPYRRGGFITINEADFDEKVHVRWSDVKDELKAAPKAPKGGEEK